ncbi:MAG: FecR domain-containing protein, partial [Balneolaceae bacterium]
MPSNTIWKLIQQYVTGNCSPQSRHKLEQWMSQDPANRKLVEEVESIWRLTPDEQFDVNVQEAWSRFYRKEIGMEIVRDRDSISGDTQLKDIKLPARSRESAQRPPSLMMHVLRAAAVFLVAAFAGYFTHATITEETQTEQSRGFYVMQEMVTDSREKASVSFSDGTEVILNSASSLRFPEGFDGSTREIYLDGEAYFDVAHHAGQPFIVHTEDATIKVLGTKFNVQAWSEDIHADIAVREGKVAVSSTADLENS